MKTGALFFLGIFMLLVGGAGLSAPAAGQTAGGRAAVLDRDGREIDRLTDGDTIRLRAELPAAAGASETIAWRFAGSEGVLATCLVPAGESGCTTEPLAALGWFWSPAGVPQPERTLKAAASGAVIGSSRLVIAARPVVMVHGYISSWEAWQAYLGPDGFLAADGLRGFAVGDGQAAGALNTGRLDAPYEPTGTIAENAAVLGAYIEGVRQRTGAEKVDLLVHSMGGMISRYYIDRLMPAGAVAQLIILGTPMAGSDCANLPAALGFFMPASLEIQPTYMVGVFNRQVYRRHGVPFYGIAGTQILEALKSPCTAVPSDIVVARASVLAIPMAVSEIPLLHSDLPLSPRVYETFVRPRLQTPPGGFPTEADPPPGGQGLPDLQFTRVFTGDVTAGGSTPVVVPIDPNVTLANFALYDPTRSLAVTVRGASGNVIELDPETNGLIEIDDPSTMVYLGYAFANPRPGAWEVTVRATESTPAAGTPFALAARFQGGALLEGTTSNTLPRQGEPVTIAARLTAGGQPLTLSGGEARVRGPSGTVQILPLTADGDGYRAVFTPQAPGLYGITLRATALTGDGFTIDRAASLAVEAQPAPGVPAAVWAGAVLLALGLTWLGYRQIRRRRRRS